MNELTVMPTTLVAVSGEDYHAATGSLGEWLKAKIAQMVTESDELDRVEVSARARDFHPGAYQRMRARLAASRVWYEKLLAGMEAGYTLMPDLPLRLFAVRTNRKKPPRNANTERGRTQEQQPWRGSRADLPGQPLPVGEGRYVGPLAHREVTDSWTEDDEKGKTTAVTTWANVGHSGVALPVALVKPELVEATGKAMDRLLFDEIGLCVPVRGGWPQKGDPLVMGRIYRDSRRQKAVCFVIGWYVQVRDLL